MLLAIDVGNTNMEFGLYRDSILIGNFRMGTKYEATSDEIGLFIHQYFSAQGISRGDISDIIVASVVPQVMYSLTNALLKYVGPQPLVIGDNITVNIDNLYDRPAAVGADRIVTAYAAYRKYGGPLIVVDFGTATTLDAVDKNGAYLGGAIYPGVKISMDALFQRAAKLSRIELQKPPAAIGRNTEHSMQSGVYYGYIGGVRHIASLIDAEMGGGSKLIATGGLSVLFAEEPGLFDAVDKSLSLDGLYLVYAGHMFSKKA